MIAARKREISEWEERYGRLTDLGAFKREILPTIQAVPLSKLVRATDLSLRYCSQVRRGERIPHPRHWQSFVAAGAASDPPGPDVSIERLTHSRVG
jgi:hypothetical protein